MKFNLLEVPFIRNYLETQLLCRVKTDKKLVALTFDDGPNPAHTPAILDLLERKHVRATFFLVGRRVRQYPDLAREIASGGHEVGNHGMNHIPVVLLPPGWVSREVCRGGMAIEEATGSTPRFFRPPMGWFHTPGLNVVRNCGYEPVIGDIHPRDFTQPGVESIVSFVLERVVPGSIVILHDGGWRDRVDRGQTVAATECLIDRLTARGFGFRTLSQLVKERE